MEAGSVVGRAAGVTLVADAMVVPEASAIATASAVAVVVAQPPSYQSGLRDVEMVGLPPTADVLDAKEMVVPPGGAAGAGSSGGGLGGGGSGSAPDGKGGEAPGASWHPPAAARSAKDRGVETVTVHV